MEQPIHGHGARSAWIVKFTPLLVHTGNRLVHFWAKVWYTVGTWECTCSFKSKRTVLYRIEPTTVQLYRVPRVQLYRYRYRVTRTTGSRMNYHWVLQTLMKYGTGNWVIARWGAWATPYYSCSYQHSIKSTIIVTNNSKTTVCFFHTKSAIL